MEKKFFKVVASTTENNKTGNGKNQRLEIQAYKGYTYPLDQSPLDIATRVQLMLAGINEWTESAPVAQVVTRRLFSGMINTDGNRIKDGEYYNKFNVGDKIPGDVHRFDTTPYQIGENTVNQITVFVFDGEDAITVANRQLGQNGACVLIDGKPTASSEQLARRMDSASPEARQERSARIAELLAKATAPSEAPAKQDVPADAPVENAPTE
jgi:hypothetical protein